MKFLATSDRRLVTQLGALAVLVLLPLSMLAFNGLNAIRGILADGEDSHSRAEQSPDSADLDLSDEIALPVALASRSAGEKTRAPSSDVAREESQEDYRVHAMQFGVFDPRGEFDDDSELKLRHVYVSWADFDAAELYARAKKIEMRGGNLLLTIEPWPINEDKVNLLSSITGSKYNDVIDELAGVLSKLRGPVYVSWGHEMDQDLTERYAWSGRDPKAFTAAYRHVVDRMREKVSTELHWIWAGVLKQGSLRYWPGDEYVDFVGMPIYSFPVFDQRTYGYIRDFRHTFEEKSAIVKDLGKPLFITEMGVSGSPDFESFWLHQAFMSLPDYPEIAGILFFYAKDTEGAWGSDLPTPDWHVHPESIRGLVQWCLSHAASSDSEGS